MFRLRRKHRLIKLNKMANYFATFLMHACVMFVLILSASILYGWYYHNFFLIHFFQFSNPYTPMQANTAVCCLLASISFLAMHYQAKKTALFTSVIILLVSTLTLLEYGLSKNFSIDTLIIKYYITAHTAYNGRMSLISGCGLFFIAATLICLNLKKKKLTHFFAQVFAVLVLIIGIIPLGGYMGGIEAAHSLGQTTHIAVETALAFILLGIAFNIYIWPLEIIDREKKIAAYTAVLCTIAGFLFSLFTWQEIELKQRQLIQNRLDHAVNFFHDLIYDRINSTVLALRRMTQRWEIRGKMPYVEWRVDAKNYIQDIPFLNAIEWIDPSYHIQWVEPIKANKKAKHLNIRYDEERKEILLNVEENSETLTQPLDLVKGSHVLIAYLPINVKQQFIGLIAGILDINKLIKLIIPPNVNDLFALQLTDNKQLIYSSNNTNLPKYRPTKITITLFNRNWVLSLRPKQAFLNQYISFMPYLYLIIGIFLSLLMGVAVYYAITSVQRNKKLIEKTEALKRSEMRHQQLVDGVHDYAIYWLDLEGNVASWNSGAERIKGYTAEEIIGKNFSTFYTPEDRQRGLPHEVLATAFNTGKYEGEGWRVCKNGARFWAHVVVEALRNTSGKIIGFAKITQDITKRKYWEMENARLVSIIEESSDFIGMADLEGRLLYHNRSAKKNDWLTRGL